MLETREIAGKILKIEFEEKPMAHGTLFIMKLILNGNRYTKTSNFKKVELTTLMTDIFEGDTVKITEEKNLKGFWDLKTVTKSQSIEEAAASTPTVEKITTTVGGEKIVEETCNDKQYVRIMSVRFAIELSSKETPVSEIVKRATEIEIYIKGD